MSSLIKPLWYFGINFFLLKKMYECEHVTAVTLKCDSCFTANTLVNFTKNINETQYLLFYKLLYIIDLSIFNIPYKTRHFEDRVSFFLKSCVYAREFPSTK